MAQEGHPHRSRDVWEGHLHRSRDAQEGHPHRSWDAQEGHPHRSRDMLRIGGLLLDLKDRVIPEVYVTQSSY